MVKSLILVRHAKTEPRSPELEDSMRQLTTAGIRSANAALPRALSLVENPKDYRIWSSPAVRAWQTAEIVADALGLSDIDKTPDLYSDEVAALLRKLNDEEGHIVLVGHNPYLEEMAESLHGAHLHFNKCAVACYVFPDGSLASADLAWFVQGPDSSRWETLLELESGLQGAARKASGAMWAFLDDPKDLERSNEVRETLRRCLALTEFIRPYISKKHYRQMKATMESYYRDVSALRKIIIPGQDAVQWSDIPVATPEAQRMYDRLRVLETERNRIVTKLQAPNRQRDLREANQGLRTPDWKPEVKTEGIERAELRRRFKKMKRSLKQATEEYNALPEDKRGGDELKKLRKQEERLGFVADSLATVLKKENKDTDNSAD
jgi:phosphohistidine phosphatase SixA